MISRVRFLTFFLCCAALIPKESRAWTEPGISFSGAFSTLKTTAVLFRGQLQKVTYDPPAGVTLNDGSFSLWGGSIQYRFPVDRFQLSVGLEGSQLVLVNVSNAVTAVPKLSNLISIPVEASYKLVVLQRQVLRMGLGTMGALPFTGDVTSGYRVTPSLGYELRGELRSQIQFFYDLQRLNTTTGTRDETTLGILLKLSLPGRRGLRAPSDERT
ncbi:MAG: hypothetical protein EBX52_03620 [Proteobacteria bacterium]|nr:hypothetical protein [Pseudomonadota bacterium]